jgi:hypothetical protein
MELALNGTKKYVLKKFRKKGESKEEFLMFLAREKVLNLTIPPRATGMNTHTRVNFLILIFYILLK